MGRGGEKTKVRSSSRGGKESSSAACVLGSREGKVRRAGTWQRNEQSEMNRVALKHSEDGSPRVEDGESEFKAPNFKGKKPLRGRNNMGSEQDQKK